MSFNNSYVIGKQIGKGGFGKVFSGSRRSDGRPVAIKFIPKRRVVLWHQNGDKKMPLELVLLQRLQSIPTVIRLLDHFECTESFILVMERLEGVDMFDYINEQTYLSEVEAQVLFSQVLHTIIECHRHGIVHRDIKDENVIVERKTGKIKLIDFGSGAFLNANDEFYNDFEGTRVYAPPEWIGSRKYKAESSTVWQLGILLFDMVFGNIPFETDTQILAARLTWFRPISRDCRDLISRCLQINAADRPTLAELAQHSWIAPSMKLLQSTIASASPSVASRPIDCAAFETFSDDDEIGSFHPSCETGTNTMDSLHVHSDASSGYSSSASSSHGMESESESESTRTGLVHVNSTCQSNCDCAIDGNKAFSECGGFGCDVDPNSTNNWLPKIFSATFSCVQVKMQEMGIM